MLFKNARILRFTKPMAIDPEKLDQCLRQDEFKPCGPQEMSRQGWTAPLGKHGETLVHAANGDLLICLHKQEKILPGPVVKEFVEEKVETIEIEQGRKVRRKEKDEIKEQVLLEMLPQAFPKNKRIFGYLSPRNGYLVVDAPSAKVAEDFASTLRKSLGSLPVRPPAVNQSPAFTFTGWLQETIDLPDAVVFGGDCELKDPSEDGGVVRCKGLDLKSDEIRNHLDAGMQATKLTMTWDDNVSFCLDEELGITRLKFGENVLEQLEDVDADDTMARFDAAFCLMTLELSRLIPGLLEALGGEDRSAVTDDAPVMAQEPARVAPELNTKTETPPMYSDTRDPLYQPSVQFVAESRRVSVSSIQRKFKIGYNRACHLVEAMESEGVVSPAGHNGAREVLVPELAAATA